MTISLSRLSDVQHIEMWKVGKLTACSCASVISDVEVLKAKVASRPKFWPRPSNIWPRPGLDLVLIM